MRIKPIMVLLVGETAKSSLKIAVLVEQSRLPLPTGAGLSGRLQSRVVHAVRPRAKPVPTAGPNSLSAGGPA